MAWRALNAAATAPAVESDAVGTTGEASPDGTSGRGARARFGDGVGGAGLAKAATRAAPKLGLSTTQGAVAGIKMYAAIHAVKEGAPPPPRHFGGGSAAERSGAGRAHAATPNADGARGRCAADGRQITTGT
jgi:hypothetical protein